MVAIRWIGAFLLLLAFLWIAWLNIKVAFKAYVLREPTPSWIPFLGGISGLLGVLCLPVDGARLWWWLPLVLDWGSMPGTLLALLWHGVRAVWGPKE